MLEYNCSSSVYINGLHRNSISNTNPLNFWWKFKLSGSTFSDAVPYNLRTVHHLLLQCLINMPYLSHDQLFHAHSPPRASYTGSRHPPPSSSLSRVAGTETRNAPSDCEMLRSCSDQRNIEMSPTERQINRTDSGHL